jgi:type II secretory ATPase GspE/PulE/Tfp pilus assembly ATPase PilB-like protein
VHTNDAAGAVTRLVDLGLEPFMVASSLVGVVSIRLVRVICPRCKESYEADAHCAAAHRRHRDRGHVTLYRGAGCPRAGRRVHGPHRHLRGARRDDAMRTSIVRGASEAEIRDMAIKGGMRPIGEDGLDKTMRGTPRWTR